MPKPPPPPRSAQNRSGCSAALAATRPPSAVTTSARRRASAANPCRRLHVVAALVCRRPDPLSHATETRAAARTHRARGSGLGLEQEDLEGTRRVEDDLA